MLKGQVSTLGEPRIRPWDLVALSLNIPEGVRHRAAGGIVQYVLDEYPIPLLDAQFKNPLNTPSPYLSDVSWLGI